MTWEIFLGIVALVGFIISIGKLISNNTKAMTEVKCGIDELRATLSEQKNDISWIKSDVSGVKTTLSNHETRLVVLEHDEKKEKIL